MQNWVQETHRSYKNIGTGYTWGQDKQSVSMHAWFQIMTKFDFSDHQEKL